MSNTPATISLHDAPTLSIMRFNAPQSHKAAILPFYVKDGEVHMVVYAPVPQHEETPSEVLPFQLARGTIQAKYKLDGKTFWMDKGRDRVDERARWIEDETPAQAALREAHEELGLPARGIQTLYDCGRLPYQNPRGKVYTLYTFLAKIEAPYVLDEPDPYACAARLDSVTLAEIREMAARGEALNASGVRPFKPTYVPLMIALHDTIRKHCC